ncbi:hypothetical protein GRF29_185g1328952 [Pseudopithomyces chartarum]|uniref:AB hydrolase-1 domain-containing protein n=1 Tax=Pseudopithomyces chartarum TaxID=1892770 RepID=A0AAN6LND8_9PLEO|nr:hypothetical protein GRF29_185g1328952 [Pseudopithomyces chartarum]
MLLRRHRAATHIAATLSAPKASPLHLLRYYLSRPGARRTLAKTVSFGGASLISLGLSTPVRIEREASSMAVQEDDEMRGRGQQPVLASQREKAQSQEGRVARWFPLSAKEGFSQWWAGTSTMATEHRVLSFIPHLQKPPTQTQSGSAPASAMPSTADLTLPPRTSSAQETTSSLTDPYGPRRWNSEMVALSGKDRALNEFSVERLGETVDDNLVMLHGYGAGLGFFYRNFEALSRAPGWKVYALDLLGMGRSSRPAFKIHAKDKQDRITEAENFFIDALEEWRIKRGLDKFTLLGHSLGGYLACCYALKYPGHLNKLILASPVGIPEDPFAVNDDLPDPKDSTVANEFTQDASTTTNPSPPKKDPPAAAFPAGSATSGKPTSSPPSPSSGGAAR